MERELGTLLTAADFDGLRISSLLDDYCQLCKSNPPIQHGKTAGDLPLAGVSKRRLHLRADLMFDNSLITSRVHQPQTTTYSSSLILASVANKSGFLVFSS